MRNCGKVKETARQVDEWANANPGGKILIACGSQKEIRHVLAEALLRQNPALVHSPALSRISWPNGAQARCVTSEERSRGHRASLAWLHGWTWDFPYSLDCMLAQSGGTLLQTYFGLWSAKRKVAFQKSAQEQGLFTVARTGADLVLALKLYIIAHAEAL